MDNPDRNLDDAVIVAIGGNLPGAYASVQALLAAALDRLGAAGLYVVAQSGWWRSSAWPDPADPPFLNAVALVATDLEPVAALIALHAIEAEFGRVRAAANAPRTLDLDLVAHGRTVLEQGGLVLPHPRAHERAFVMRPLAQIAPRWRHPTLHATAADLAASASVSRDAALLAD